ncbi:MAG TPA: M28 family peptidase, partial [Acidobacteriota bacterium]|nr:M28 family peptidase [Acidobacteriota bacterium]
RAVAGTLLLVFLLGDGCASEVPGFDAQRAFEDLVRQTEFGPRVPGTAAHRACADWLHERLADLADSAWRQPFMGRLHGVADSVPMINLVGRFRPQKERRVLLGAHWDTRPFADLDPDSAARTASFAGANDGASGIAVLLEIARALQATPPPVGVDLAFFDGEDAGAYGETTGLWIQGSRYFAAHLPADYAWVIVVDMVGDRDLRLLREGHSLRLAPDLVDRVWNTARRIGETAFLDYRGENIIDDHLPFLMRGIPAVDIIDFDFPYWHTTADTPDNCAPASLGSVGRVLLQMVYSE